MKNKTILDSLLPEMSPSQQKSVLRTLAREADKDSRRQADQQNPSSMTKELIREFEAKWNEKLSVYDEQSCTDFFQFLKWEKKLPKNEVNRILKEANNIVYLAQKPFVLGDRMVFASSLEEAKERLQAVCS